MQKITALAVVALTTVSVFAQTIPAEKRSQTHQKSMRVHRLPGVVEMAMKDLSPSEKRTVTAMIAKQTPDQKAAMLHALESCVGKGPMPRRAITVVSTGTMTPAQRTTYKKMYAEMTPDQRIVLMKMLSACCVATKLGKTVYAGAG